MGDGELQKKQFFLLHFFGGGFGTIFGMYKFRHKTKKLKFTLGLPTILITEIGIVVYLLIKYKM